MNKSSKLKTVVIGFLGNKLDSGRDAERWHQWRPTVGLCQHDDLLVDRFDLLHASADSQLAELVAADIESVSPETMVRLHPHDSRDPWDFEQVFSGLYEFARNYPFRTDEEQYLIHISTGTHVHQICMFLLAESRHLPGKLIQTSPSPRKSWPGVYRIIDLDLSRYDAIATRFAKEQADDLSFLKSGIRTRNQAFNALIERIERVAIASRSPILLTGPTGAGKSQLARRIYELKRRREQLRGPLVEVNCATLRGDSAMSALFGHTKGSYTGATTAREGLMLAANGGLLFLDEIGELGLEQQAMLLRAIEEKRFLPVGADREVSSDFQLIAGTNRALQNCVAAGRFREDLLARIDLWTFALPGIADRREDIEPNLDFELLAFERSQGTKVTFNREAKARFIEFAISPRAAWRGNFRDLVAAVTRMATLAQTGRITLAEVEEEIDRLTRGWTDNEGMGASMAEQSTLIGVLDDKRLQLLDLFDRVQLEEVIRVCKRSKTLSEAGRFLFANSRLTKQIPNDADRLRKYLSRFELSWERIQTG